MVIGTSRRSGIQERNASVFSWSHNQLLILVREGHRGNILIAAHPRGRCIPVLHLEILGKRNYAAGIHSGGRIGGAGSGDEKSGAVGREHRPCKCEWTRTRRRKAGHVVIG